MVQLWFLLALSYAISHGVVNILDRFFLKNKDIDTMSFSTFRYVINSLISLLFVLTIFSLALPTDQNFWIYILLIVFIYTVAGLAYFHMMKHGDVSKTIPLGQSINTLMAFLLALSLLGEKTTLLDVFGTALIIIGGYIILTDGKIMMPKISKEVVLSVVWGLFLALFGVVSKPATNLVGAPVLNVFLYSLVALNFVVMSSLFKLGEMKKTMNVLWKNKKLFGTMILCSFLATAGTLLLFFALAAGKASEVLPISRSMPLFTALFGWLFLKEKHGAARIFGAAVIVLGIYFISI